MRFSTGDQQTQLTTHGNFSFSNVRLEKLTEAGYTLICIGIDTTGSIGGYEKAYRDALLEVLGACRSHPKANTLLVRTFEFNSMVGIKEFHGYLPVTEIEDSDYPNLVAGGMTPLYDAIYSNISSMTQYGQQLMAASYNVNGIGFTITDGGDNSSQMGTRDIDREMKDCRATEKLESIRHIILGCGNQVGGLDAIASGMSCEFQPVAGMDSKSLARMANFISRSISSTSQSLGSGGPSQPLTF